MTAGEKSERVALAAIGTASVILGWLAFGLVNQQIFLGALMLAAMLALIGIATRARLKVWSPLLMWTAAFALVLEGAWLAVGIYPIWVGGFVCVLAAGFTGILAAMFATPREPLALAPHASKRLLRVFLGAGTILAAVLSGVMVTLSITTLPLAVLLQSSTGNVNSFEPVAKTESKVVNGALLTNDLQYGDQFPNSYLDIYIADNNPSVNRPTYVIVHGGGFLFGSKSSGDPNADGSFFAQGTGPVMDAGYNVVAIDYALAPQVPYPAPVKQLGQAIDFLQAHGEGYGLDMDRIVLAGGSAGGHIAAQYANIQTNPAYADQMGIAPTLEQGALKGLVLDSAFLDPFRGSQTQTPQPLRDDLFALASRAYLGTDPDVFAEANVISHVSAGFPPTFISDGNTGTFPDQAADLSGKLNELGVKNILNLYPRSEAVLGHGFMAAASPYTDDYNRQKLAFLADILPQTRH